MRPTPLPVEGVLYLSVQVHVFHLLSQRSLSVEASISDCWRGRPRTRELIRLFTQRVLAEQTFVFRELFLATS